MFARDLYAAVRQAPNGRGLGFFYREPEWLPVVGWEPGAANPNDNLTLFDWSGRALDSIDLFGRIEPRPAHGLTMQDHVVVKRGRRILDEPESDSAMR